MLNKGFLSMLVIKNDNVIILLTLIEIEYSYVISKSNHLHAKRFSV